AAPRRHVDFRASERHLIITFSRFNISVRVQKEAVGNFKGQNFVDLVRVVSVAFEMAPPHSLKPLSINIRSAKTSLIQKHFPHVVCESIPVPNPEVGDLMSS